MADKTAIEWTDATWNPTVGCSRAAQAIAKLIAKAVNARGAA